jgi:hypothetical protein
MEMILANDLYKNRATPWCACDLSSSETVQHEEKKEKVRRKSTVLASHSRARFFPLASNEKQTIKIGLVEIE